MGYILRKKKMLACGCFGYAFSRGRCKMHAMAEDASKRLASRSKTVGSAEMERWFHDRRLEMRGICAHCGGQSCMSSDVYFKFSICHILPKAYFKSVETHPLNWIELCFWTLNCHGNMDHKILDLTEMNCWDLIVERFLGMYSSIAPKERRRIPDALMQYVRNEIDL